MERNWAPRHWPESRLTGVTLIAAALMLAAPLWCVWAPAMPDYPAHLASFALIEQGTGNTFYHLDWDFVPNLASEVLVPWLARLTGLVVAAKLFLTIAIYLWVLGPGAVHRALYGRTGIAPLFGSFFAYNANFVWGFFNYYFSTGLSFAVFAVWIATEKRKGVARLAGFTLAVTLLYFCHVFAAATLLLMLAGYEVAQNFRLESRDPAALLRRAASIAIFMSLLASPSCSSNPMARTTKRSFSTWPTRCWTVSKAWCSTHSTTAPMSCRLPYLLGWRWRFICARRACILPCGGRWGCCWLERSSPPNGPLAAGPCTCASLQSSAPCCLPPPNCR